MKVQVKSEVEDDGKFGAFLVDIDSITFEGIILVGH